MPVKTPQFIPLKPVNGRIEGKGYQCTACGLAGVGFGEPHISSAGKVCYPALAGEPILVRGLKDGSIERLTAPGVETEASIQVEMKQVGEQFQARIKAAKERETAAHTAAKAEPLAVEGEPVESQETYAARLAAATKERDAKLAAEKVRA